MSTTKFIPGTIVASSWANDVDRQTYTTLSGVTGTNTITAVGPNSITSLSTGQLFYFSPQNTGSGPATINITCNAVALGAKNIVKYNGVPLVAQDLIAGCEAQLYYDGVNFQLMNPQTPNANALAAIAAVSPGRLLAVQTFTTASGTYTPTAGTKTIVLKHVGSGGAGGNSSATGAGQASVGGGGGGGGYGEGIYTGLAASYAWVLGAGGAAGSGASGASSNFGALMSSTGGSAGAGSAASAAVSAAGGAGGIVTGANIFNSQGQSGQNVGAGFIANYVIATGAGGSSLLGPGAPSALFSNLGSSAGVTATGFGGGGAGAGSAASAAAFQGGGGARGIFIVYEYA